ncbi:MAG: hypothetical protein EP344_12785 [Bacteroidetes bacterium]|nr:MAG: hypothetical protein EP344_12785 [Bacteroidota bacterium]
MLKHVIRQLYFTKAERHGAVALLLLSTAGFAAPHLFRVWYNRPATDFSATQRSIERFQASKAIPNNTRSLFMFDPNTAPADTLIALGLSEKLARTIVKYRERGGRFRHPDDLRKIYTLPEEEFQRLRPYVRMEQKTSAKSVRPAKKNSISPFPFDPNTASRNTLEQLGLPGYLVERLIRYREKGGKFREPADLRKLYGLSDRDYRLLEPYIQCAAPSPENNSPVPEKSRPAKTAPAVVDINTATLEDWTRLPGIGPYRAKKILQYRERLGGFIQTGQVAEAYGLPDSVFLAIQGYLKAGEVPTHRININTASEQELASHPYISYKQARLITAYRAQHGSYNSTDDLNHIIALADQHWLKRVQYYLTVE